MNLHDNESQIVQARAFCTSAPPAELQQKSCRFSRPRLTLCSPRKSPRGVPWGETMAYQAPVLEMLFTLNHVAGFARHIEAGLFEDLDLATVEVILEEAGRFATEQLAAMESASRCSASSRRVSRAARWSWPRAGKQPIVHFARRAGTPCLAQEPMVARSSRLRCQWPAPSCGTARIWRSASIRC